MTDFEEVMEMRRQGNNSGVVKKVNSLEENGVIITPDMKRELAWAYYHLGRFDECKEIAFTLEKEGDNKALDILAHLNAYVYEEDPGIALTADQENAIAIWARNEKSKIWTSMVVDIAIRHMRKKERVSTHIVNNVARVLLSRANVKNEHGRRDVNLAISFWNFCLLKYGEDENYNHRAALCFWLSKAHELLEQIDLAIEVAERSIELWEIQVKIDPDNKAFANNLANAYKRLEELKDSIF
jgi:tetratricopeptide (TPR) repeat protein